MAKKIAERIRIDRVSGAIHDLIRSLNKPGHDGMTTIIYENIFFEVLFRKNLRMTSGFFMA
jgi:hypothetical protein